MSSVWSSHIVVLATAMAVSGTMIFLSLHRSSTASSSSEEAPIESSGRRSCLSSVKKYGKRKKKVRFAENVKYSGMETMDINGAGNLLVDFSR